MKNTELILTHAITIIACVLGSIDYTYSKDLYVSPFGNDSFEYVANDIEHPWKTVDFAFKNSMAGDTVFFRAGVYAVSGTINLKYAGADGKVHAPITFTGYPGEMAIIDGGTLSPVVEMEKDHYHMNNLHFVGGGIFFRVGWDTPADGFRALNCSFRMRFGGDNVAPVYTTIRATQARVEECVISGPALLRKGVHGNTAGVIAFRSPGLKVLECEIFNVPIGVYFKHANDQVDSGIEIAGNYIHDTDRFGMELNCNYGRIHDNLMGARCASVRINEANGGPGGDCNVIEHNTFYNCRLELSHDTQDGDPLPGAIGNTIMNNIFMKPTAIHEYGILPHRTVMDYNLYPPGKSVVENRVKYTLSEWMGRSGQDIHSIQGVPAFMGGKSPDKIQDFKLRAESPGYRGAIGGRDMGANAEKHAAFGRGTISGL